MVVSSRKQENVTKAVSALQDMKLDVRGIVCHVGSAEDRKNLVEHVSRQIHFFYVFFVNSGHLSTITLKFDKQRKALISGKETEYH